MLRLHLNKTNININKPPYYLLKERQRYQKNETSGKNETNPFSNKTHYQDGLKQ